MNNLETNAFFFWSSMGLGGGFLMTIYDAPSGEATFLNARETVPGGAHSTMFRGNKTLSYRGTNALCSIDSFFGILL